MQVLALAQGPALAPGVARRAAQASPARLRATQQPQRLRRSLVARADGQGSSGEGSQQTATPPAAADQQQGQQQQREEEDPIWVRRERERAAQKQGAAAGDLPFGAYLLFSAFTAIAAVGSIFEYANQRPIFDVVYPDSPLYTPILGFFAVTGLPTAGFLFYKAVSSANAEADRLDKLDGY